MDNEFKTTFIPKKNLSGQKAPVSAKAKGRRSLFGMLALLLFVTAIVSIAGVYLYKIRIASVLNSRIESINRAEKAFEPAAIVELKKLDIRLDAGTKLLNQHVAISDFLNSFGESTLPGVSFSDFQFTYNKDGSEVAMSGEARGYLEIAQQSDIFEDNLYVQNAIFSDFELTDTKRISFSLQYTLAPNLLVFGRTLVNQEIDQENEGGIVIPDNNIPQGIDVDQSQFNR